MDKRFCASCGKQLDAGKKFCMYCGAEQPSPASPAGAQTVTPPVSTQAPLPPPSPKPKKRWPLLTGIGVGVVVIAAVVLFLTGVISFGSAPAFDVADLNGAWNGTVRTDSISGAGSQSSSSQVGQTGNMTMDLTLDQNGKGTAVVSGQSMTAELNGSTLSVNGQFNQTTSSGTSQSTTFNLTGDITKDAATYSFSGTCNIGVSGVTVSGTATLQHTSSQSTAGQTTAATAATAAPYAGSTTTLEGTYQYMYDVENSDAAGIEFQKNGTCVVTDTADNSRTSAIYVISGNTLNMTLFYDDGETVNQTYDIVIGTGKITLTRAGKAVDFIRVE